MGSVKSNQTGSAYIFIHSRLTNPERRGYQAVRSRDALLSTRNLDVICFQVVNVGLDDGVQSGRVGAALVCAEV